MSRPGGRLPAGDLRPLASQARTSCGFCEGGHGRCKGTWPHFVRATAANPDGLWTCACSAPRSTRRRY
jgi:hypothetical protein